MKTCHERKARPIDEVVDFSKPHFRLSWSYIDEEIDPDKERIQSYRDRGYTVYCNYELVMPLTEHDARRERYNKETEEQEEPVPYKVIHVGGTYTDGKFLENGILTIPFRDGAHIGWDCKICGFDGYVVYKDLATKIMTNGMEYLTHEA